MILLDKRSVSISMNRAENVFNLSLLLLLQYTIQYLWLKPSWTLHLALVLLKKREVKTIENYLLPPGQTIKTFQHSISQHWKEWTDQHDTSVKQRKNLSPRQESNPWPPEHRADALSTELRELTEGKVISLSSKVTGVLHAARIVILLRTARNMLCPTTLRYVAFKCCSRLAGACKCWANNGFSRVINFS